jgi:hypothetical protein
MQWLGSSCPQSRTSGGRDGQPQQGRSFPHPNTLPHAPTLSLPGAVTGRRSECFYIQLRCVVLFVHMS